MAKRQKRPGELGKVTINTRGNLVRARTTIRDGAGEQHRLEFTRETEELAVEAITHRAREIWGSVLAPTSSAETIGELANLWLSELPRRVELGRLKQQSAETYEANWRTVLEPRIAAIPISKFEAGFVDNLLEELELEASRSNKHRSFAHTARKTLSLMAGVAIRNGLMVANPVAAAQRLSSPEPDFEILSREQLEVIFELARSWEGTRGARGGGVKPNKQLLLDSMVIMLATSMRPGEVLAIRRQDYILQPSRDAVRVTGTIVFTKEKKLHRQAMPKDARQERTLFVAEWAMPTFRRLLASYEPNDDDLLIVTKNLTPISVNHLGKLFRSFREFYADEFRAIGLNPDKFIPRSFRKTHATLLATEGNVELAQSSLGHSDMRITMKHYIRPDDHVSEEAAILLDKAFGGGHIH